MMIDYHAAPVSRRDNHLRCGPASRRLASPAAMARITVSRASDPNPTCPCDQREYEQ
jgi:hypothetical protein